MKYKIGILFVIAQFSIAIAQVNTLSLEVGAVSPKASLQDISWIAGHWIGEAFGGITEEIWSPPLGNSMMGIFKLVNKNKVSLYEALIISEKDESLILRFKHFNHDLTGWEEKDQTLDFPLVKLADNKVYFDDFTFERISDDEINLYVMIGKAGEKKEVTFNYKRSAL